MTSTRTGVEQRLAQMAQENPQFRSELLQDPKGTLAKMFGGDLPADVNVQVHEEDAGTVHIVLPAAASAEASAASSSYCSGGDGHSWSSCGYELSCYGPTCC